MLTKIGNGNVFSIFSIGDYHYFIAADDTLFEDKVCEFIIFIFGCYIIMELRPHLDTHTTNHHLLTVETREEHTVIHLAEPPLFQGAI